MNALFDNPTKPTKRQQKKNEKEFRQAKRNPKPLTPKNRAQAEYITSITDRSLTFAVGPAGSGKTYCASRLLGEMLKAGTIKKIYAARPNVAKAKHRNGFLPGTLEEKTAPWLIPIFEGIKDAMSPAEFERFRKNKDIEEVPFEFMQGRTFSNAGCIVDEAENLDLDDFYITLTRQGENLTMIVCGDIKQARIPDSGLAKVVDMVDEYRIPDTGVIRFTIEDVVRSGQAKAWVEAFDIEADMDTNLYEEGTFTPPDFLTQGK